MPLFVKTTTAAGTNWSPATKIFVKTTTATGTAWSTVKKMFTKVAGGWVQFWPKKGPITTTSPLISTIASDLSGASQPPGFTLNYGTTYYGQKGIWDPNLPSTTISSYSYIVYSSTSGTLSSGPYVIMDSGSISGNSASIPLTYGATSGTTYDGKYLIFSVTATRSDGATGSDDTDSQGYRYWVMLPHAPTKISSYTDQLATFPTGSTITYTSDWNGAATYSPDSTRNSVTWYKSLTNINLLYGATPANIIAYATPFTSANITTYTPTNNGTTYEVVSRYVTSSSDSGYYFYAIDTQKNSNSDYNSGTTVGVTQSGYTGLCANVPVNVTAPTWTLVSGTANTTGTVYRLNFGTWSNTPTYYEYEIYYNNAGGTIIQQDVSGSYSQNSVLWTVTAANTTSVGAIVYAGNASALSNPAGPPSIGPMTDGKPVFGLFTYDTGMQSYFNGSIKATVTSPVAVTMTATVYRSGSSTWASPVSYDTASSTTGTLIYSVPSSGYYYITVTATNSFGSTTASSTINNTTFFYGGIPYGTSSQSVTPSTTYLGITLNYIPANWQSSSPYTGDNITYRSNNSSFEYYRSTSSATPAQTVTPNATALPVGSYSSNNTWLDTGAGSALVANTLYYYWIRGRNNDTYSGWQSMGSATTPSPPVVSVQPTWTLLSGTANKVGATYRLNFGTWSGTPTSYYWQIEYNDAGGTTIVQDQSGTYTQGYYDWTITAAKAIPTGGFYSVGAFIYASNAIGTASAAGYPPALAVSYLTPSVSLYPSLSGTGQALSYITFSSGTYTNYTSKTTTLYASTSLSLFSAGSVNKGSTSPYQITNADAQSPAYYFAVCDAVLGLDGLTYYYWSGGFTGTGTTGAVTETTSSGGAILSYPLAFSINSYPSISGPATYPGTVTGSDGAYTNATITSSTLLWIYSASTTNSFSYSYTQTGTPSGTGSYGTTSHAWITNDWAGNPTHVAMMNVVAGFDGVTRYVFSGGTSTTSASGVVSIADGSGAIKALPGTISPAPTWSTSSVVGGWTASVNNTPSPSGGTYSISSYTAATIPTINSSTGTITQTGLTSGQSSSVTVAYSVSGYTSTSTTITASAFSLSSPTPTSVTYSAGNFYVYFSGGSGPYYEVYYQASSSGQPALIGTDASGPDATGTSSPVNRVLTGSSGYTYYWWMRSAATSGGTGTGNVSAWSGPVAVTIPNATMTTAPTYGSATPAIGGFSAAINNTPNPTGGTYALYSASAGTATVNSSTGAVTVTGLTNGASSTVTVSYSLFGYNTVYPPVTGSAINAPGAFTYSISDSTITPSWPVGAGINITGSTTNVMTVTWNAASNAASSGTNYAYGDQVSGTPANSGLYRLNNTSDTWNYTASGTETATVYAYNYSTYATISWTASTGAASYFYYYSDGVNTVSGNTTGTAIRFPVVYGNTASTFGVSAWTGAAATGNGTGGTLSGSSTVTPTVKSTSSSASFNLTYTVPPIYPTISMGGTTNITTAGATINWSQSNASYDYVDSTYVGLATAYTFSGLAAGTFYSGTVTVFSTTGNSASASYSFTTTAAAQVCTYSDYGSYYFAPQCYTIPPATCTGTGTYGCPGGSCCPNINKAITNWNCLATDVTSSSSPDYFNCYSTGACTALHALGRTACAWRA